MWHRTWFALASIFTLAVMSAEASGATRFGSKLTNQTQPSNAGTGKWCNDNNHGAMCSWVMTIARNAPGRHRAPKDGVLNQIRLIACFPGTFVLQIANAKQGLGTAKAVRTGPLINYVGDSRHCNGNRYQIETFAVNVPVKKNDYLSVVGSKIGFVYCAGDSGSLLFNPPLADGGAFRTANDNGDCIMLLEAQYDD